MKGTCPYCKSVFVCWNWIHCKAGTGTVGYKDSDGIWKHKPNEEYWGHECWDCSGCFDTDHKVLFGIPYFALIKFYNYFRIFQYIKKTRESKKLLKECKAALEANPNIDLSGFDTRKYMYEDLLRDISEAAEFKSSCSWFMNRILEENSVSYYACLRFVSVFKENPNSQFNGFPEGHKDRLYNDIISLHRTQLFMY